ncbi:sugar transferase [Jeotgalibacillus haloalkalitolerans]|uniref:Sugar transferase n=1 Tax=Jeotgalibacillus haloalkalitolerans TaxID=3104292 RepID=A0ABU5KIA6_9BACL|nr:sugar transferase [Jeotgalibacillus sp. HH7-29]MDZ5710905.1 sugar transferase [Jeotgalibacillus sp. HH7-29]
MYIFMKRTIDIVASFLLLFMLSPLLLFIMLLIKVTSPGPVIFKQKRIGLNKKEFIIYKFRTMKIDTPSDMPTHLLKDENKCVTRIGAFLRKTSLDELPQLMNIFLGHMSFVGPRPALWNQADLILLRDRYSANSVRPGLTGWAQINGRDYISIERKAFLDGEYIRRMNLKLDFYCLYKTVAKVLKEENVGYPLEAASLAGKDESL